MLDIYDLIEMFREWGNKPYARMVKTKEVQVFDISQEDKELNKLDEHQMWYEDRPETGIRIQVQPSAQEEDDQRLDRN